MQFLSFSFLVLFVLCFALCYALRQRFRNGLLLLVSFVFIAWYHLPFLITAVAAALFTFAMAQRIEQRYAQDKSAGGAYLTGIVGLVLAWLFFHYSAFSLGIIHTLVPFSGSGSLSERLIIPLGMSFYTFQAIGYLTDIYWQEYKAERNPVDFMLYMLFFMKFLSGPIERGETMLAQLKHPKPFEYASVVAGLKLIFLGLFKKLLIANQLTPYTDAMFSNIHNLSGVELLMTCLIYPIELYADFSGYSDIAIGGAKMLGIELSPNFKSPFAASSTSDLWRRWHMSLSFWVRDYLYVPLTATARAWGLWGIFLSLIVTFVALGVWHGAGWTFAIYGLIQGLLICCETAVPRFSQGLQKIVGRHVAHAIMVVRTYLLFSLSLVFFRIGSLPDALYFLRHISFSVHHTWKELSIGINDHSCLVAGSALLLLFVYEYFDSKKDLDKALAHQPALLRWSIYYILAFVLLTLGKFGTDSFIYLQF
ncbi:MBOAT family O-acyltransferase [uncultured Acetobacteroides sp.]|uniref:MBOAT family O-acyltransferase n=1 Tax=uncultured Acetobacteroides sp. TaxID=1760811 RepID=UPI0029F48E32|nr:MBOAT family O-acyltransferase [uncultured Acetobacteroides sp.]